MFRIRTHKYLAPLPLHKLPTTVGISGWLFIVQFKGGAQEENAEVVHYKCTQYIVQILGTNTVCKTGHDDIKREWEAWQACIILPKDRIL